MLPYCLLGLADRRSEFASKRGPRANSGRPNGGRIRKAGTADVILPAPTGPEAGPGYRPGDSAPPLIDGSRYSRPPESLA